jgi:hypothetical protein
MALLEDSKKKKKKRLEGTSVKVRGSNARGRSIVHYAGRDDQGKEAKVRAHPYTAMDD